MNKRISEIRQARDWCSDLHVIEYLTITDLQKGRKEPIMPNNDDNGAKDNETKIT